MFLKHGLEDLILNAFPVSFPHVELLHGVENRHDAYLGVKVTVCGFE